MIKKLQRKFALSEQGAKDLIKGCTACVFHYISLMFPVGILYLLVGELLNGGVAKGHGIYYAVGCVFCVAFIMITTWFQYNGTYFATYTESGVRRISLAEKLRKLPLSYFGKRILLT